jgi:SAM-dependent methyltransferase
VRPRIRQIVAAVYKAVSRSPLPEELVEVEPGVTFPGYIVHYGEVGPREAETFLDRMPAPIDLRGKSVLDIGCGLGSLCIEAARRGARRTLGVDTGRPGIEYARWRLGKEAGLPPVEFRLYGGDPDELGSERFDVVLSKDSFERYHFRPPVDGFRSMAERMAGRLEDGGLLAMRLGPLWKAPYGGHIDAWLPWAHLIFPEDVIFERYRATRAPGKTARTFDEGVGVNKLTLSRFRAVMDSVGLECLHFATNVGDRRAVRTIRALSRLPGLEEFLAHNVYGIWRRPVGWRAGRGER